MEWFDVRLPFPLPASWRAALSGAVPGIASGAPADALAAPVAEPLPGDPDAWIACEHCDTLHRHEVIALDEEARCTRCGVKLYRNQTERLSVLLPLVVTGLIVYIVANAFPIAEMDGGGNRNATTLWNAVEALYNYDMPFAAALVALTTGLFPLMYLVVLAPLLIARARGRRHPSAALALRAAALIRPWAMIEIFMLGAVVALIKVAHMVSLEADTGLWAFAMLTVFMTIALSIDLRPFWRELGLTHPPAQADAADAPDAAARPGENESTSGEAHP
ncbi:paraquat-inducible protein A [Ralstonia pseudosolanacearum]|uniref:Paraquat-inducible protein A n=1 Tax=Ralstonia solanacearum TaxID=305 RepID=A0AA92QCZ5_RALSL|nr:paraquat-inducible protein A [Ralstonia pseudosolanacearum]QOK98369.1 paraquat-inducible protein A [Ralstonia pseudosolanacearum]